MRTIVELPAEQLDALEAVCQRDGISRAEAVRQAVAAYVRPHQASLTKRAFGLWRARGLDGLKYQAALRREWDR
jgi:metal-responsive CopG/Arc/MetJ family transcriptional regulator